MFYLLLSSTKGKRNRFRKRVRVKSSIQFEWRHCKKNNNTFLNHCAQDNFNSWLEFKATGCNKLRIRLQVISTKRSVQIFWFALGSKQPLNSDMCSQCSLHSSSAHYQINRKPTGNTERLLLLLFFKVLSGNKDLLSWSTDTDSPCCLVSISDSQVNFPNNSPETDETQQHAQHRPLGRTPRLSRAGPALTGGASSNEPIGSRYSYLRNLLTGHIFLNSKLRSSDTTTWPTVFEWTPQN